MRRITVYVGMMSSNIDLSVSVTPGGRTYGEVADYCRRRLLRQYGPGPWYL